MTTPPVPHTLHARLVAALIIGFARAVTGVRALWHGCAPSAAPTVYFANHTSHGDFVLLWAALPGPVRRLTRPVAAADYWSGSALRRYIGCQVFRALLIARDRGPGGAPSDPVAQMAARLAAGDSLIMFPEGTRNTGEELLLPLKSGLYHLAQACPDARLVPVWIENLRRVLPKGSYVPIPLACSVDFGAPLQHVPGETKAAFLQRARAAMLALRPASADEPQGQDPAHDATRAHTVGHTAPGCSAATLAVAPAAPDRAHPARGATTTTIETPTPH